MRWAQIPPARNRCTAMADAPSSAPAPRKLRWGFISTADIGSKNARALTHTHTSTLYAVASRDKARADAWAREHGASVAYGSYEELIADPLVEAVYIPLPTALHRACVCACARAGKHVLCEKPAAVNLQELAEMVAVCAENGVQWMDGTMFSHHARLPALRAHMCGATHVGALRRVTSGFSFMVSDEFLRSNIRMDASLEPMGALGAPRRVARARARTRMHTHARARARTRVQVTLDGTTSASLCGRSTLMRPRMCAACRSQCRQR